MSQLNGKLVDGVEMVKSAEVPLGGYGVFPKADLSEVYVKTWSADGRTKIITYHAEEPEPPVDLGKLEERISALEQKLTKEMKF